MKKFYLFGALATLMAASMVSCSDDDVTDKGPTVSKDQTTAYASVRISMGSNTRANEGDNEQDFADGTSDENEVKSILLLFYDAAGTLVGTSSQGPEGQVDNPEVSVNAKYGTYQIELTLLEGAAMPTQVVAFVNPTNSSDLTVSLPTLESMLGNRNGNDILNTTKGFSMNNSVQAVGGAFQFATPITENCIYTDPNEASEDHEVIEIYVERVAAKITVPEIKTVEAVTVYDAEGEAVELLFKPEGWLPTATAKDTWIVKHMSAYGNYTATNASADANYYTWMRGAYYRTYWAESPNYATTINKADDDQYPVTGSTSEGTGSEEGSEGFNYSGTYILDYISYKDVNDAGFTAEGTGYKSEEISYVLENTFPGSRMKYPEEGSEGWNPWAVPTSVVITGTYGVEGSDTYDNGFYIRKAYLYNEEDGSYELVDRIYKVDGEDLINSMVTDIPSLSIYAADAEGTDPLSADVLAMVYLKTRDVVNEEGETTPIETPANMRFVQVADGQTIYKMNEEMGDDGTVTVTWEAVEDLAELNGILKALGYARLYQDGHAFFYVPLRHHIYADEGETPGNYVELDKVYTGTYGIVRNNWYDLEVNSITKLGIGIGDDDDILLPDPEETQSFYIDANLNVLQWHMRSQSVDL